MKLAKFQTTTTQLHVSVQASQILLFEHTIPRHKRRCEINQNIWGFVLTISDRLKVQKDLDITEHWVLPKKMQFMGEKSKVLYSSKKQNKTDAHVQARWYLIQ